MVLTISQSILICFAWSWSHFKSHESEIPEPHPDPSTPWPVTRRGSPNPCHCLVVILFLLRKFCRPTALNTVFKFCGNIPSWADTLTQIAGHLQGGLEVPVNVLEIPWRYPLLVVVYYADTIEDIIWWFNELPALSILVPTHLFGPDIIIKYFDGVHLLGQVKSCLEGNINEIVATMTAHAINSLNPMQWFTTVVCLSDSFLCLLTFVVEISATTTKAHWYLRKFLSTSFSGWFSASC